MVRPKKALGQHFLTDENIAAKIVDSMICKDGFLLEIGPGKGVLTKYLIKSDYKPFFIEMDDESVEYLNATYPNIEKQVIHADFLRFDLSSIFAQNKFNIIGNFPYNISSQIFFKVLERRDQIDEVIGMIQKEVAERLASKPGTKKYGILSVLLQAFYEIDYLFTVNEGVFFPPPKVKSAVIRLRRNEVKDLGCDEKRFVALVKTAFNQRRKTLRNAIKSFNLEDHELLQKRAEQLSVEEFVFLTNRAVKE